MPDADRYARAAAEAEQAVARLEEEIARQVAVLRSMHPSSSVQTKYVRCGRKCHCTLGKGHGPYFVVKRRDGKRVREIYLGKRIPERNENTVDYKSYLAQLRALNQLRERRERALQKMAQAFFLLSQAVRIANS